ncbi:MAG: hypothetical protein LBD03_05695 [Methanobrevibacter sp.]|jgi:hypothetical protein|nr:hypothetical protein [Candidatus Methanovirga procula]
MFKKLLLLLFIIIIFLMVNVNAAITIEPTKIVNIKCNDSYAVWNTTVGFDFELKSLYRDLPVLVGNYSFSINGVDKTINIDKNGKGHFDYYYDGVIIPKNMHIKFNGLNISNILYMPSDQVYSGIYFQNPREIIVTTPPKHTPAITFSRNNNGFHFGFDAYAVRYVNGKIETVHLIDDYFNALAIDSQTYTKADDDTNLENYIGWDIVMKGYFRAGAGGSSAWHQFTYPNWDGTPVETLFHYAKGSIGDGVGMTGYYHGKGQYSSRELFETFDIWVSG